jgi:hypothetical protein
MPRGRRVVGFYKERGKTKPITAPSGRFKVNTIRPSVGSKYSKVEGYDKLSSQEKDFVDEVSKPNDIEQNVLWEMADCVYNASKLQGKEEAKEQLTRAYSLLQVNGVWDDLMITEDGSYLNDVIRSSWKTGKIDNPRKAERSANKIMDLIDISSDVYRIRTGRKLE